MRDYLDIGSSPVCEDCQQVGSPGYYQYAKKECGIFIQQLLRDFPNPPAGVSITIKSNPHDFGTYYSVVVNFNDDNKKQIDYAYKIEAHTPEYWDEIAIAELKERGVPVRDDVDRS
jgi:hypothetical protein